MCSLAVAPSLTQKFCDKMCDFTNLSSDQAQQISTLLTNIAKTMTDAPMVLMHTRTHIQTRMYTHIMHAHTHIMHAHTHTHTRTSIILTNHTQTHTHTHARRNALMYATVNTHI